jgi:lipoate-protein ligase A
MRLVKDVARRAGLNMAVDEVLMESQRVSGTLATLRFYSWSGPSCTMGYFQNLPEISRRLKLSDKKILAVKRLTGGGMVVHGDDLTFSLATSNPSPWMPADVKDSYLKVNEALRVGLQKVFPGIDYADCKNLPSARGKGDRVCFEVPSCYDLLMDGKKIVGASQRRSEGTLLHQSTIFLKVEPAALIAAIVDGFERKWGVAFEEIPLSGTELEAAVAKERERYSSPDWSNGGRFLDSSLALKQEGQL